MQTDYEWQRPIRWAGDEPHCLCPLTEAESVRAAAWAELWAEQYNPAKMSGRVREYRPVPKVQADEDEGRMALQYVRDHLSDEELERFLDSGERPYSLTNSGSCTFTDESDPLVGYHVGYDGRGVNGNRESEESKAADREWFGFWRPRYHDHHNPGHQAYAPPPKPYRQAIGRWEISWSQVRLMLQGEREAARQAELQPSLF